MLQHRRLEIEFDHVCVTSGENRPVRVLVTLTPRLNCPLAFSNAGQSLVPCTQYNDTTTTARQKDYPFPHALALPSPCISWHTRTRKRTGNKPGKEAPPRIDHSAPSGGGCAGERVEDRNERRDCQQVANKKAQATDSMQKTSPEGDEIKGGESGWRR